MRLLPWPRELRRQVSLGRTRSRRNLGLPTQVMLYAARVDNVAPSLTQALLFALGIVGVSAPSCLKPFFDPQQLAFGRRICPWAEVDAKQRNPTRSYSHPEIAIAHSLCNRCGITAKGPKQTFQAVVDLAAGEIGDLPEIGLRPFKLACLYEAFATKLVSSSHARKLVPRPDGCLRH